MINPENAPADILVPGGKTFGRVRTIGKGRPIVLLHGWAANGEFFAGQTPLAGQGIELIIPDLPGHGPGAKPDSTLHLRDLADALAAFLHHARLIEPVLVGWSMGASVALDYLARENAAAIAGLVIVDMTPKVANDAAWRLGLANGQGAPEMIRAAEEMAKDWTSFAPRIAKALFARGAKADAATLAMATTAFSTRDPETMASLWRSLATADFRATLAGLRVPTLAILGARSRLYGPELAEWYRALATGMAAPLAVTRMADTGHSPHLEAPERFNAALLAFVERLSDKPAAYSDGSG